MSTEPKREEPKPAPKCEHCGCDVGEVGIQYVQTTYEFTEYEFRPELGVLVETDSSTDDDETSLRCMNCNDYPGSDAESWFYDTPRGSLK